MKVPHEISNNNDDGDILIVDHDSVSLYVTKEILQFDHHKVSVARSCLEAMDIYSAGPERIRLIICDASALMDDRLNFIVSVKKIRSKTRIIVTASMIEMKKIGNAFERHSVEVLVKPYDSRMLKEFVKSYRE